MKHPLKKEYLNLYQEREGGGYAFTGSIYRFTGESFKKRFALLTVLTAALGAVIVASGCLNAGGMRNCFYVILPYIGEVSAFFALTWNLIKLLTKGERVKEYVYQAAYPRIPRAAAAVAVFEGISLICSAVFLLLNGAEGGVAKCVLYLVLKLVSGAVALVLGRAVKHTAYVME